MEDKIQNKIKKLDLMRSEQRELIRKLASQLHGKTMDYESCSMLESFINDYTDMWISAVNKLADEIKDYYEKEREEKLV